jgi:uncharacterized membrane protein
MAKIVIGLFDDFTAASDAVRDLASTGDFPREDISFITKDAKEGGTIPRPVDKTSAIATGAGVGAVIGTLLLGVAILAVPGIGSIVAAGPVATILSGAALGAVTGGLLGVLVDLGVPEEEARYYDEGVRRGGTLVMVRVTDDKADPAREILRRHHAVDIDERVAQWRQSGWSDFDPGQAPQPTDPALSPELSMDEGRVILERERPEITSPADSAAGRAPKPDES